MRRVVTGLQESRLACVGSIIKILEIVLAASLPCSCPVLQAATWPPYVGGRSYRRDEALKQAASRLESLI